MLSTKFTPSRPKKKIIFVVKSKWIRARSSGLFRPKIKLNTRVEKGATIGYITDAYGKFNQSIKADFEGHIININQNPIVYKGDAILHFSTQTEM